MKTVLFVGGGSIGHIAPSIAVAQALIARHPDVCAHFVCLPKIDETEFIRKHGFPCSTVDAPRMSASFPFRFLSALQQSGALIQTLDPAVVFSKGGYVSVPVCLTAHRRGIPLILHESDAVSGYANRLVARWASHVCNGFPTHASSPSRVPHSTTGNPVRKEVTEGSRDEGLRITGLAGKRPVLLITGGSQGAATLNDAVWECLDELLLLCDIVHLTGAGKTNESMRREGYWQRPFVTHDLPHLYACADLALSRAGAGSIAELATNSIPTILVPLRGVGHDHQYSNALAAAASGGCMHLEQEGMQGHLLHSVEQIVRDSDRRATMSAAIRSLASPEASGLIAEIIVGQLALRP